ncbi:hypothetical protein D9M72_607560 [compost metagenome]
MFARTNLGGRELAIALQDLNINAGLGHGLLDTFSNPDIWLVVTNIQRYAQPIL